MSVLSRNLRNLKILKSPHEKAIDKKIEQRAFEFQKVENAFSIANPKSDIYVRISDNGLKSAVPVEDSYSLLSKPTKDKKKLREVTFDDYSDTKHTKSRPLNLLNKSTEDLRFNVRRSTESLPSKPRPLASSFLSLNPSSGLSGHRSSMHRLKNFTVKNHKINQSEIRHRIQQKLHELKQTQGEKLTKNLSEQRRSKIFATELSNPHKRYIAILPDGCNIRKCQGVKVEINKFLE